MENLKTDQQMLDGFQIVLEGLKRLPMTVCMSVFIDDSTTITVSNYDENGEKKFHINLHHECDNSTRGVNMLAKHDSKRLVFDLVDSLNLGYESDLVQYLFKSQK